MDYQTRVPSSSSSTPVFHPIFLLGVLIIVVVVFVFVVFVITRGVRAGLDRGRAISARFHRKNAKKRSFSSRPQNGSCRIVSSYLDEFSYETQFKIRVNFGCNSSACIFLYLNFFATILLCYDIK